MADETRILVVEDNPMSRELAHDLLEDAGYHVREAATVAEAVAALAAFAPAVVLLDWHLKGATGADVLRTVRASTAGAGARVLVVTADIRPELRAAAIAAGADALITKPYRAAALAAAVADVLNGSGGEGD